MINEKKISIKTVRHTALNEIVKCALGSVHIPATLEPPGLLRSDNKRPDGMSLLSWSRGQSVVWDVTVVDALAPSRISNFAPGKAAEEAESRKRSKYTEVIQAGYNFIPSPSKLKVNQGPTVIISSKTWENGSSSPQKSHARLCF